MSFIFVMGPVIQLSHYAPRRKSYLSNIGTRSNFEQKPDKQEIRRYKLLQFVKIAFAIV